MSSSDEETIVVSLLCHELEKKLQKKKRKYWVHPILVDRKNDGEFHTLFNNLVKYDDKFKIYFRMSHEKFSELLNIISPEITRQDTYLRESISPTERLAVCLRYLATGDSFTTISFSYRLGISTVQENVLWVCEAIWKKLGPIVMPTPTEQDWKSIEAGFRDKWNFPNCIGALDGKHVVIQAPGSSGSLYFNYKKTFSIVLLALVDADYQFILVDVGQYGKNSDGSIFSNSTMGKYLEDDTLNVPQDKPLPGTDGPPLPHVIVGDEAFPLKKYLMRPYPGVQVTNDETKKIYNYRHSRCRRVVENAFGILTQRFRIYFRRIQLKPENVDKIVLATCCLHNFLRNDSVPPQDPVCSTEKEEFCSLENLRSIGGNASDYCMSIREEFKNHFNSSAGSVPWQWNMVRRGRQISDM